MRGAAGAGLAGALALSLSGCAAAPDMATRAAACPQGQEPMRLAQLFFGRATPGGGAVSEAEFKAFLDEEITPRFPAGLTVLDGGGQWRGAENQLIREASKVVLIVIPARGERAKVDQVREAYKARFKQESVLLVTQQACVAF